MPSEAEQNAEREIEAHRAEGGVGERVEGEVGRDAQQDPRDADRGGRRAERGDRDAGIEAAHQFFQHEDRAGDRGVERGGEAGTGAGGEQDAGVGGVAAEDAADEMGDARAHLHRRPFAAEREAGADRQQAADEFHREQEERSAGGVSCLRTASTCGMPLPEASGEKRRTSQAASAVAAAASATTEREAEETIAVGPGDEGVAEVVGLYERAAEASADEAGGGAGEQREQRERRRGCRARRAIRRRRAWLGIGLAFACDVS